MSDASQNMRLSKMNSLRQNLFYSLFFLSGAAALIYEASWSRLIGLVIGNTAQSVSLVLAAYFFGLGLGQLLGGKIARHVRPLLGYGVAELGAAAWSCLVPALLDWVGAPAADGDLTFLRDSFGGRALSCFLVLLPVTTALGSTLPLVVEGLAAGGSPRGGLLAYGLNTAGGMMGMVAAGAFLIILIGVRASGFVAAAISGGCGLIACVIAIGNSDHTKPEFIDSLVGKPLVRSWYVVAAISGFGTLGLEVLYTRMFALIFHNSTYTFGAVIVVFLLALSLGAALAYLLGRSFKPEHVAIAALLLGGLTLAHSVALFPEMTGLRYFSFGDTFGEYLLGTFGLVMLFVLPPITFVGMTLPLAIQAALEGHAIGRVTAVNTFAGAAGALVAGFLLPPIFGLWSAFGVLATLFCISAAGLLIKRKKGRLAVAALIITAPATLLLTGVFPIRRVDSDGTLLRRWESAYGWVDVVRLNQGGALDVRQNLHYRHGSTADLAREYRQGRLPLLLHPEPAEVAFLGLGTGLTAASALADQQVKHAVIVELIPEVVEASRLLASDNLGVVDHPKVDVYIDDARHHLLRTNRKFDVIVSDLFVPWETRTGYLYTVEFYETVQRRLKPGGLFCQWVALYQLGPEQFESVANSFSSVFPNTTIWWGEINSSHAIVALIGTGNPIAIDAERMNARWTDTHDLPGGADLYLNTPADLRYLYLGDWTHDPSHRRNTDEHPWLEFTAPISHRSGQTLQGPALKTYFTQVLSRLSSTGVRFSGGLGSPTRPEEQRRAMQTLILFGDVEP